MAARFLSMVLASGVVAAVVARPARADAPDELKKLVQAEIKAVNEKKKEDDTKDGVFKAKWKDGISFETPDKKFTFKIGGRIHFDSIFTKAGTPPQGPAPGIGDDFDSASYFRRLRLFVSGDIGEYVDYKIQVDFATPQNPEIRDAYITLKNLKTCLGCWVPNIRAGHQYDPVGLETQSSSNHNTFIERSLPTNLHPDRQIGFCLLDSFWKDRATAQLGLFSTDHPDDDQNGFAIWDQDDTDGGTALTGRFTVIPWAADTCRFLHLGASASLRNPNQYQYRARPGLGRGPRMIDTGTINGPGEIVEWNAELALVLNSLHLAAEYTSVAVSDAPRGDPTFTSWYVQAGWFLTGESKAYDFKKGVWGNTKPCCNFLSDGCCCKGALELAARYDTLDLTEGTITGGEMKNIAIGLNWYLNPNLRLMFDYVRSNTKNRVSGTTVINDADVSSFVMRWDLHF